MISIKLNRNSSKWIPSFRTKLERKDNSFICKLKTLKWYATTRFNKLMLNATAKLKLFNYKELSSQSRYTWIFNR